MRVTYIPSSNTATNGVALGSDANTDVRVFKILVGAPVNAGNIFVYSITNPVNGASTNIAAKITLPTFSTTNINPGVYVIDFGPGGLPLAQGGNVIIDQTMQVSVIWELADNSQ